MLGNIVDDFILNKRKENFDFVLDILLLGIMVETITEMNGIKKYIDTSVDRRKH